ncbi:MAG: hypothetical protein FJ104_12945, partial [Deltaproteobacteria bacterium]|nr:hypothetical protein [Deltaproteobacteria bacterium]
RGLGYTWAWPDGVITTVAHYPVGFPALIGAAYGLSGRSPAAVMVVLAVLGALAAAAVHRLVLPHGRRAAALAGLAAALHPGLVMYTPAFMTEGLTASLLAIAATIVVVPGGWAALGAGVTLGLAALVRPQVLLMAPGFALLAPGARGAPGAPGGGASRLLRRAIAPIAVAVGVAAPTLPWVARNCSAMGACGLSANGGWNLYIGNARGATGTWTPLEALGVPDECRTVWDEAAKDECFGAAARRQVFAEPLRVLGLVPGKLASTFDYAGAAGWYLHAAAPGEFPDRAKVTLGVVETAVQRALVALALLAALRAPGPRPGARRVVAMAGGLLLLSRHAFLSHVALVLAVAMLGRAARRSPPLLIAAIVVGATAAAHAVFFGAGRYSLPAFPAIAGAAGLALRSRRGTEPDGVA